MKILIPIVFAAQWLQGCTQPVDELPGAGQWRVINYWAIWCAPCREEIPELNALNDSTELMVFAVNYDGQNGEALQSQAAEMGITFTLLEQDPGAALGVERPRVLPTTLLVDPEGAVTATQDHHASLDRFVVHDREQHPSPHGQQHESFGRRQQQRAAAHKQKRRRV